MQNARILKVIVRILIVSAYAYLVAQLILLTLPANVEFNPSISKFWILLMYFFIFNLNTEGSLFFDRLLNKKLPWGNDMNQRLILQFAGVVVWSLITIGLPFTFWYYKNGGSFIYPPTSIITFLSSIAVLFVFVGMSMMRNFYTQKQNTLLEIEHLKQEKLKADYRVLQNQVNPHFLFNSLNALISEIKHNPEKAIEFTRKMSKVYRYVLQSKNYELISLSEEIDFIESFIFLHKVRIGDALEYSVNISEETLHKQIPPLTLQILIENAIKHNIANEENVLKISIESKGNNQITVSNNLQAIENTNSTYTGLSNLSKRFELLKKDGFTYKEQDAHFVVSIPLIDK